MRRGLQFLALAFTIAFSARAQITVASAASYQQLVSPNSLASIFGSGLANSTASAQLDSSGQLPTQLADVTVTVNNINAGLLYVSPTQINFLIPADTDIGTATVAIQLAGFANSTGTVQVRNTAPALFSLDASGKGPGAILNAVTFTAAPFFVETPQNPGTDKRTRLAVFATGLRYAGNPSHDPTLANAAIQVQAQDHVGNIYAVEFAGAAPGFFGLDQVNLIVPPQADGSGDLNLSIVAEGRVSNGVTIQVGSLPASSIHLAGLTLAQPSIIGGSDITGTVALNGVARTGGYRVNLSSDSLLVQIPTSVTVPAGSASANFTAHSNTTATTNTVNISASGSGVSQSAKLTIFPTAAFTLTALTLGTNSLTGGATTTGKVTLSGNPPLGGATIVLTSDNPAVIVPPSVNVAFGQSSASFTINTTTVPAPGSAKITATYSSSTVSTTLAIKPALTIALSTTSVTGGAALTGTISLANAAPAGGSIVSLRATDPAIASVPASLLIPVGQSSGTFTVATASVTASTTVAIAASFGGVVQSALLIVNQPGVPVLTTLTVSSSSIHSGATATGTVTLNSPAPAGGVVIDLLASNPFAAQIPAFVSVPQGQTSATFTINAATVTSSQTVTITASAAGISRTATLTVQ